MSEHVIPQSCRHVNERSFYAQAYHAADQRGKIRAGNDAQKHAVHVRRRAQKEPRRAESKADQRVLAGLVGAGEAESVVKHYADARRADKSHGKTAKHTENYFWYASFLNKSDAAGYKGFRRAASFTVFHTSSFSFIFCTMTSAAASSRMPASAVLRSCVGSFILE